jgi:outer membrane receptor protein involved in Fe transport
MIGRTEKFAYYFSSAEAKSSARYSFLSPKAGHLHSPTDWMSVYCNYSRGVATPRFFDNSLGFSLITSSIF